MKHCLLCNDQVEANGLSAMWSIRTSTGRLVTVAVQACIECSHTRRVTLAEVFDLARRRADRQEQPHAATT